MQYHIEPFDNKNNPIVDVDNKIVPLVYFNHIVLKYGETFNYFLENHESIVSVVSGSIDVFVDNVRQEPTISYTVSATTLTFTAAPDSGTNNVYVVHKANAASLTPPDNIVLKPSSVDSSGDIDSDGDLEIVAGNDSGLLHILHHDGSEMASFDTGDDIRGGISVSDINDDGSYEILFTGYDDFLHIWDPISGQEVQGWPIDLGTNSLSEPATADLDNDGDLDMYLLNHNIHTPRNYTDVSKRLEKDSLSGDKFFENKINEQEAKFVDVSESSGIFSSPLGYGLAITTADVNNDGWVDLYVGNDFHENDYIYINQKNKSFKEKSKDFLSHNSRFTMGVDIADMNNDKLLDIFTLDMMPFYRDIFLKSGGEDTDQVYKIKKSFGYEDQYARNNFHLNRGNSKFTDIALYNDTYSTDWSWSVLLEDFNNDGKNDIFISNGIYKRPNDLDYINYASDIDFRLFNKNNEKKFYENLIDKMPTLKIPNILYLNKGDLEFQKMTHDAGMEKTYSNGAAYGDFDNDGDLDLIVNNINQQVSVLENITSNKSTNNFVKVSLVSYGSRFLSIGSRVDLYYGGKKITKQLNPVKGFQSSSSYNLNFGLGKSQIVDSLKIIWADGKKQTHYKVELNQINTFEKNDNLEVVKGDVRNTLLLEKSLDGVDHVIHLACISNDPSFELNKNRVLL